MGNLLTCFFVGFWFALLWCVPFWLVRRFYGAIIEGSK